MQNESAPGARGPVFCGVDTHADSHWLYISMLERAQRELKPIRRAYEAWVEAGLPLDWDRQAFEAERKMDSKKHLAK